MTPVINNQTATTIIPVVTSSNHNDRDSNYYKDLMNKYRIDEQYAKTKSDKAKAQKLYQYNEKRYEEAKNDEKIAIIVVSVFVIIVVIAIISAFYIY